MNGSNRLLQRRESKSQPLGDHFDSLSPSESWAKSQIGGKMRTLGITVAVFIYRAVARPHRTETGCHDANRLYLRSPDLGLATTAASPRQG